MSSFLEIAEYTNLIWKNQIWPILQKNINEHLTFIQSILDKANKITNIYKKLNLNELGIIFSDKNIDPSIWNLNCSLSNFCLIEICEEYEYNCLSEDDPSNLNFWIMPHHCESQALLSQYFLKISGYSSYIKKNIDHIFVYLDDGNIFDPISLLYSDSSDINFFKRFYQK